MPNDGQIFSEQIEPLCFIQGSLAYFPGWWSVRKAGIQFERGYTLGMQWSWPVVKVWSGDMLFYIYPVKFQEIIF